ncbi:hypothetical protein HHI36_013910 [Cryptolaemus montrouzieri]|uniref:GTPase Era, mitochondrial n=1 Tax=Cryptolaemus montrouzieri TaxID=559131 RepID=A0ABD2N169_9CUCU
MNSFRKTIRTSNIFPNFNIVSRFLNKVSQEEHAIEEELCKSRLLKVAIIGMPNAGKSTIINSLMDRKVCPTSSKVHTTMKKSLSIFTEDDAQIIFLDTPGIVTAQAQKKYNLKKTFVKDGIGSLHLANLIGVVHDVGNMWTRGRIDIKILKLLEAHKKKPSFLILNKIDLLKQKRKLLELTRKLTENRLEGRLCSENIELDEDEVDIVRGWPFFNEIFMISALTGSGIEELRNYLIDQAKPAPWMFLQKNFQVKNMRI